MRRGDDAGYDRRLTMFSPEGRLYQVEYALEAVKRGALCVGLKSNAGAAIITRKKFSKLMDKETVQKIFKMDDHIGVAISGLHADSRVLVDYARVQAQVHRLTYNEPVRIPTLTRKLADIVQAYTQHGGVRPFGSSLLICGVDPDGTPRLMTTSPSGTFWAWEGHCMGENSEEAEEILKDKLHDDMSLDEIVKLGIKILKDVDEEEELDKETIQIGLIGVEDKKFKILDEDGVDEYL